MALGPLNKPSRPPANFVQVIETREPFDLVRLTDQFKYSNTDWSIPEAILCILFHAAMADNVLAAEEQDEILVIAQRSRALRTLTQRELAALDTSVSERMSRNSSSALEEACATIPSDMRLAYFAHCVEIILSDGSLLRQEMDFLEQLRKLLEIEEAHATKIKEVLFLKAQY